jgi:hypothetical protein
VASCLGSILIPQSCNLFKREPAEAAFALLLRYERS